MFFDLTKKEIVIRVRLTPNAAQVGIKGIFVDDKGCQYLKISVLSPPEKGKANKELVALLAKKLKMAKSEIELVSGEVSHYKKLVLKTIDEAIAEKLKSWSLENDSGNN